MMILAALVAGANAFAPSSGFSRSTALSMNLDTFQYGVYDDKLWDHEAKKDVYNQWDPNSGRSTLNFNPFETFKGNSPDASGIFPGQNRYKDPARGDASYQQMMTEKADAEIRVASPKPGEAPGCPGSMGGITAAPAAVAPVAAAPVAAYAAPVAAAPVAAAPAAPATAPAPQGGFQYGLYDDKLWDHDSKKDVYTQWDPNTARSTLNFNPFETFKGNSPDASGIFPGENRYKDPQRGDASYTQMMLEKGDAEVREANPKAGEAPGCAGCKN